MNAAMTNVFNGLPAKAARRVTGFVLRDPQAR
jgi:hypothetical protein